jgi:hypothetical protein
MPPVTTDAEAPALRPTTVTAVTADGYSSLKLTLSNDTTLYALVAGGESNKANAANREVLLAALARSLKTP